MSIIHVSGSTGGGLPSDRTSFVGTNIPDEVKNMIKHLKQIDKTKFRKILQVTVSTLEGNSPDSSVITELTDKTFSEEAVCYVFAGLHKLLQLALRLSQSSLKPDILKEDLQELRIKDEFIQDIVSAVFGSRRSALDKHALDSRPRLPQVLNMRSRVDVAISTSSLSRVLEPTVLMEMTLSSGEIHTFNVPVSKFHELRYSTASVLKEMADLEKRSILKIQD